MFWTRLLSGIIMLIIAIVATVIGGVPLWLLLLVISLIAYRELTKALLCSTDEKKLNTLEIVGLVGVGVYYITLFVLKDPMWLFMTVVGVFMAEMLVYVLAFPKYQASQVMGAVFAFLYAPVMLAFAYLTRVAPQGIYTVWFILISSWGCDTCAYAVGKLFGKTKIFPVLSPHKSLEGCLGGMAGSALLGALYGYFLLQKVYPGQNVVLITAFICTMGAVMSMLGDLSASAIKRNHKIKDYGKLIPGHGGVMDRFDSMIVTAPMTYFLTILLLQM